MNQAKGHMKPNPTLVLVKKSKPSQTYLLMK